MLDRSFYSRPPTVVARELVGQVIVRKIGRATLSGRIVETEAYGGDKDPASHAFKGLTKRNEVMFGEAGHAYVYFTYGFHHCLNFVTGKEGVASAVLIRALEPLSGIEVMSKFRNIDDFERLTSGPGNLCRALAIDLKLNGCDVTMRNSPLYVIISDFPTAKIASSCRIGIKSGLEKRWRYFLNENRFVSRGKLIYPMPSI